MKRVVLLLFVAAVLVSCNFNKKKDKSESNNVEGLTEVMGSADKSRVKGTVTGGYTTPMQQESDGGTVSISAIPKSVKEFKELRQQIANEPHGAAACFVIALQMFMEKPKVGEECLTMCVTPSQRSVDNPKQLASVRQIIYDRYYKKDSEKNIYSPWIPYCYIEGFSVTPEWQKPNPPYKMIFGRNPGVDNIDQSASGTFQGYSIPMTIDAFDNTTNPRSRYRNITAVKLKGEEQYVLMDFDDLINTASYKRP